jgi:putative spermidine/putrescine transport system permease protein
VTPARAPLRRGYRLARPIWVLPALSFILLFFVVPLGSNLLYRGATGEAATQGAGYYYVKLLSDSYYSGVLLTTLKVATITTVASLLIGYPVAYFMARYAGRWTGAFVFIVIAPLLTSIIMRTFGWRVLLARRGVLNTILTQLGLMTRPPNLAEQPIAVYIGLVHVLVPFMVLSILAVLQGVDQRLEESARVLGAGRLRTFLSVTLPLSLDGVITGCILVFVITNGSFLTMLLLGGGRITTLSLLIYQQFNTSGDVGFAAAMGNVLMLVALVGLGLQLLLHRRGRP